MKHPSLLQGSYGTYDIGKPGGGMRSMIISDTNLRRGSFFCLVPLVDTVFAAATVNGKDIVVAGQAAYTSNGFSGLTVKAGIPVYGDFSAVQLTSGAVQAFTDTEENIGVATPTANPG